MALKAPDNIYGVTANTRAQANAKPAVKPVVPAKPGLNPVTPNGAPATPNGGMPALPPLQQPAVQMPTRQADVTVDPYKAPDAFKFDYNYLNYDTAKQRAEERYNPLFDQAVGNVKSEQYQNELNSGQNSAVRGLAHSGLAQDQLTKIAMASQGQIAGLNAQKMTNVADYSQSLLDKDQARGDALRSQMYNEYSDGRNFDYGQYRDKVGDAQYQNNRNDSNYWNGVGQANNERDYNRGVFESDRGYNYQVGRDTINDTRYTDETKYNRGQDAIQNSHWDKQFGADQQQRGIDNAFREKDWSQMSPAEKQRMALENMYSTKLKKTRSGDYSPSGGPGLLGNDPGGLPDFSLEDLMRIMGGNNYSALSNYGRGNGDAPRLNATGPESKKPHPLRTY